jgi:hypothetical protein
MRLKMNKNWKTKALWGAVLCVAGMSGPRESVSGAGYGGGLFHANQQNMAIRLTGDQLNFYRDHNHGWIPLHAFFTNQTNQNVVLLSQLGLPLNIVNQMVQNQGVHVAQYVHILNEMDHARSTIQFFNMAPPGYGHGNNNLVAEACALVTAYNHGQWLLPIPQGAPPDNHYNYALHHYPPPSHIIRTVAAGDGHHGHNHPGHHHPGYNHHNYHGYNHNYDYGW